jgi:hypothetical protein
MKITLAMLALIAGVTGVSMAAGPAEADWQNYNGNAEDGDVVCGMSNYYTPDQRLDITYYHHSLAVVVQLAKNNWRIPDGTKIPVVIGFDKDSFAEAKGTGFNHTYEGSTKGIVQITVPTDKLKSFLVAVGKADHMWIRFQSGTERPWVATGSRAAVAKFLQCVLKVMGGNGNGTT